jgi:hypothetical protein
MTNKGLYNLAKVTLATMYFNCVQGYDEVLKEAWKIIKNPDVKFLRDKRVSNRVGIVNMSSSSYVVESTTEYNFPSWRKKKVNHKAEVLYDSDKDKK